MSSKKYSLNSKRPKLKPYPCLLATPPTAPVAPPLVLVPVPPKPLSVADVVVLAAAVVLMALKPLNAPKPEPISELVPNANPVGAAGVDPSNVVVVVAAVLGLNSPLAKFRPVDVLAPGVTPRAKPELCPS